MEQIQVISRNAIPPIHSVEQDGEIHELGELRDFRWNNELKRFLPDASRFSVSWVRLAEGEVLQPHVHPIQSLMVFYAGSGQMLGDVNRPVAKDDVVVVPAGCQHGFVGGAQGLHALSIQLGEGLYTVPSQPRVTFSEGETSLNLLLAYSQRRLQEFELGPLFGLLAHDKLENASRRRVFLDFMQIWVVGCWTMLNSCQANCSEASYREVFLARLLEQVNESRVFGYPHPSELELEPRPRDALLEAMTNWFIYQMHVLDDPEKAVIISLVVERANLALQRRIRPVLARHPGERSLALHGSKDASAISAVLSHESPKAYARMREAIDEAWNMLESISDRVEQLVLSD